MGKIATDLYQLTVFINSEFNFGLLTNEVHSNSLKLLQLFMQQTAPHYRSEELQHHLPSHVLSLTFSLFSVIFFPFGSSHCILAPPFNVYTHYITGYSQKRTEASLISSLDHLLQSAWMIENIGCVCLGPHNIRTLFAIFYIILHAE